MCHVVREFGVSLETESGDDKPPRVCSDCVKQAAFLLTAAKVGNLVQGGGSRDGNR
jgi:hypothetical protein